MGDNWEPYFSAGCALGFFLAGVLTFVFKQLLWHWGRVKAIGKPQTTKSETDKSPWKALGDGCKSLISLILFIVVGIPVLAVICLLVAASIFGLEKVIAFFMSAAQFIIRQFA